MANLKEVVVIDAVRSAIGKSGWKGMEKNGQLKEASSQDLMAAMKADYPVRMSSRMMETGMTVPQGVSAEMIAEQYDFSREEMDEWGLWSHQKATKAQREGLFDHIVPFEFKVGKETKVVDTDETIRHVCLDDPDKAREAMKKLPTPFKENGRVTPGSSSQIVDGAAACMLMSADKAEELELEPIVKISSTAIAGDDPTIMLLGPIPAMKKALKRANTTMDEMDIIEPNEAFAAPCMAFAREFGYDIDDPRQNPTGGAIALGHPIGASGVIWFAEMIHEMRRRGLKKGIQMMCGGGGVGIATVVEAV